MLEKIKERIFPYLITLTALSISFIAAYVSVIGLSQLFSGAAEVVIVITSILEFSKVIIASVLYSYRKVLSWLLKIYLIIALVILMTITSIGIYGFLSSGYSETTSKMEVVSKETQIYKIKNTRFIETRDLLLIEKQSIDNSINSLRDGLANNKTQYKDKETGEIITITSSSNRKSLETQLNQTLLDEEEINLKLENVLDSITKYELKIFEIESKSELSKELGPLKYISKITGKSMDQVVNWLLILLIIVFDPLAICLVITSNFTFEQLKKKYNVEEIVKTGDWRNPTKEEIETIIENRDESNISPSTPLDKKIPENLSAFRRNRIENEGKRYS